MVIPGVIYFLVFHYAPLWGLLVAFKDFQPFRGFEDSPWVGLAHFERLALDPMFWSALANTLIISFLNLIFYFPLPIALALLLNEVRHKYFKRAVQTAVYAPHFMSWIIIYGVTFLLFSDQGLVNVQLKEHNLQPIQAFLDASLFRPTIVLQSIWRDSGWGAIVILAALATVNPQLYEAAIVDGADRWQQFCYVTLPSIGGTIWILLILRLGNLLRSGFEQVYIMQNPLNVGVSEVLDTYSFRTGLLNSDLGYATAVGLFQSVAATILVVSANWLANKMGDQGIW